MTTAPTMETRIKTDVTSNAKAYPFVLYNALPMAATLLMPAVLGSNAVLLSFMIADTSSKASSSESKTASLSA